jgi:hypothetical protein
MTTPKLCELCHTNPVGNNGYVCDQCMDKAHFQEKASIVLKDSEFAEWGLVLLTPGTINHIPADSQLVGYWHRYGEGTYWVSLMMPVQALMDRTTLLHAEVARRREQDLPLIGPLPRQKAERHTKPKESKEVEAPQNTVATDLQKLRDAIRSRQA